MRQAHVFRHGEGDAWFSRNQDRLGKDDDPVVQILKECEFIKPQRILEIGCSNGRRLKQLGEIYKLSESALFGVDPSHEAVRNSKDIWLHQGTAEKLDYRSYSFDMVIFGFCLYLIDRGDLFKAVAEADRVLRDNGYLVILDFHPPRTPYKVKYKHKEGVWSYHMDYGKLFLANPAYKSVIHFAPPIRPFEPEVLVSILEKKTELAYPEGEP